MRRIRTISATGAALLLSACTVGPVYQAPKPDVPKTWSTSLPAAAKPVDISQWWKGFGDATLDTLITRALQHNETLEIARTRVLEAREMRAVAEAALGPEVGAGATVADEYSSKNLDYPPGVGYSQLYRIGIDASWDLDVFGGNRHALEAAQASEAMAREEARIVQVSLLAELVEDYAILRTSQNRLAIAERNIDAERASLKLTERAFKAGLSREMDVERARAQVRTSEAELPPIRATIAKTTHALAVLTGQYPGALKALADAPGAIRLPVLPRTIPSDLLRNRPDIRRAERNIARAVAGEGVAEAARFPHFVIPLSLGPMVSNLSDLFSAESLAWSAALTGSQYVYDGGKRQAKRRAAELQSREARLAYRHTVRKAFGEVNDAWVDYANQQQRHAALQSAAKDERAALDQATKLYARGLADFLTVLDSERAVFHIEDDLARNDLARIRAVIAVYKAVGGGWKPLPAGKAASQP